MTRLAEKKRPTRVTIVAVLSIILGSIYVVTGFCAGIWFLGMFSDPFYSMNAGGFVRGLLIVVGFWLFFQAYGFWLGKSWTKILGGALIFACLLFLPWLWIADEHDPRSAPTTVDVIWFLQFLVLGVICIMFFIYLNKPHVKAFLVS